MAFVRLINKISDVTEKIVGICIIFSMAGIVFLVNLSVFFRYVLNSPLGWTNELARYLLVFSVLFGAGIALRHSEFIGVEAFRNVLPARLRFGLILAAEILVATFLIFCISSPVELIERAILTRTISPAIGIPMVWVYRMLRTGFMFMLFFVCVSILNSIIAKKWHGK